MIPISVKIINPNIESFTVNPKFEHNGREVKITNLPSILSWDKHKKPVYIYYSYIDINTWRSLERIRIEFSFFSKDRGSNNN